MNPETIIALLPKHDAPAPVVAVIDGVVHLDYPVESYARMTSDHEAIRKAYAINGAVQTDIVHRDARGIVVPGTDKGQRVSLLLGPLPAPSASKPKG